MSKRLFSFLLALLMVVSLAVPAYAADGPFTLTLSVDDEDKEIQVGDEIAITVGSENSPNNIMVAELRIKADNNVFELLEIINHDEDEDWEAEDNYSSSGEVVFNRIETKDKNQFAVPAPLATVKLKALRSADSSDITATSKLFWYDDNNNKVLYDVGSPSISMKVSEEQTDPVDPPAVVTGYSVSAVDAESPINVNGSASVQVKVAHSDAEVESYNAYDLTITYPEGLQYKSAAGPDANNFSVTADETNRTVHVLGYGADKKFTVPVVTLEFTGLAVGDHNVTVTSAKVDAAAKASLQDAPPATITDENGMIKVVGYTVTLTGNGLTGDGTADPTENYEFTVENPHYYDYTIIAKSGNDPVDVHLKEGTTNTYYIAADDIDGNITITAERNKKIFNVKITNGEEVINSTATYSEPYEVVPGTKEGLVVDKVTYKIGETTEELPLNSDNKYIIPGEEVIGPIEVTITWKAASTEPPLEPEKVVVTKPDWVSGSNEATKGQDYKFSITDTRYTLADLQIMVNGIDIINEVAGPDANSEYTILGNLITGPITIALKYTVEVSEYVSLQENVGTMYLVTVSGVPDGYVAKYDGATMYWSAKDETTQTGYDAYAYLVISDAGQPDAAANVSVVQPAQDDSDPVSVVYNGNVNKTKANGEDVIDVNDAQLVYNMYMTAYDDFDTATMEMFLRADMNSIVGLDTTDAAAIINIIKAK